MKKVLLFDADGVTIQRTGYGSAHAFGEAGLDGQTLKPFFTGPFLDCERGKTKLKELLPDVLKKIGWKKSVDDLLSEWFDYENVPNKELLDLIQKYRKQGIICCLVTDQEENRFNYIINKMGFEDLFDDFFCSCDLGYLKIEINFWEEVFSKLKTKFGDLQKLDILMWDDDKKVIATAQNFGFDAELYENLPSFEVVLNKY